MDGIHSLNLLSEVEILAHVLRVDVVLVAQVVVCIKRTSEGRKVGIMGKTVGKTLDCAPLGP